MQRRTLDILFSIGGMALAGLLLVLGLVMTSNANFAQDYVKEQLTEQNISFKPADLLTPEEKKADCVLENAGKALTTGKQAECYANEFIGLHVTLVADGKTYADLGTPQRELQAKVEEATTANAANLDSLTADLATITAQRDTLFTGETLRGLLLTSYGFSVFGDKGAQVATVAYIAAALLLLLSIAGFVHAFGTPKDEVFAAPEE